VPYLRHLSPSTDLVTDAEEIRAGFVALALERSRRATILTQVATNKFWCFCNVIQGMDFVYSQTKSGIFADFNNVFHVFSSPRRGVMSIENIVFQKPHPVGVPCL